jgi:hypothetical protein
VEGLRSMAEVQNLKWGSNALVQWGK